MVGRLLALLPVLFLLTGAAPVQGPGSIAELSKAVAAVDDWRAIGLFLMFVLLANMGGSAWQRALDRKSNDRLAEAIDRNTDQIAKDTMQAKLHQARVESVLGRIEREDR